MFTDLLFSWLPVELIAENYWFKVRIMMMVIKTMMNLIINIIETNT